MKKAALPELVFLTGSTLIAFLFFLFVVGVIGFTLGYTLNAVQFIIAALAAAGYCAAAARGLPTMAGGCRFLLPLGEAGVIVAGSLALAGQFYDASWDGQTYHQEAVIQLAQGWNPYRQIEPAQPTLHGMQLISWPKAPWVGEALVYRVSGKLECGKCLHFWLIAGSFGLVFYFLSLLGCLPVWTAAVLAFVIAWNPVSAMQSLSYYLDGQVSSLYIALLGSLGLMVLRKNWGSYTLFIMVLALMVNYKLSAAVYAGVLVGGLIVYLGLIARDLRHTLRVALLSLAGLIVAAGAGFNPYVSNTIVYGHPLHPLAGPDAYYFAVFSRGDQPADFHDRSWTGKLLRAVFSQTENSASTTNSHWKWPFTISKSELDQMRNGFDTRVGGWGPLFGGSVIMTAFILALLLLRQTKRMAALSAAVVVVGVSMGVNPEAWWARYDPQLWLIPCLVALGALSLFVGKLRYLGWALVAVLIANVGLMSSLYYRGNCQISAEQTAQLQSIRDSHKGVVASFGMFRSSRVSFHKAGIPFREVGADSELPCPDPSTLCGTYFKYCREK